MAKKIKIFKDSQQNTWLQNFRIARVKNFPEYKNHTIHQGKRIGRASDSLYPDPGVETRSPSLEVDSFTV